MNNKNTKYEWIIINIQVIMNLLLLYIKNNIEIIIYPYNIIETSPNHYVIHDVLSSFYI